MGTIHVDYYYRDLDEQYLPSRRKAAILLSIFSVLSNGTQHPFGRLILSTGSDN